MALRAARSRRDCPCEALRAVSVAALLSGRASQLDFKTGKPPKRSPFLPPKATGLRTDSQFGTPWIFSPSLLTRMRAGDMLADSVAALPGGSGVAEAV